MYRERRDAMVEALDDLMPAGATWNVPSGGFYVWLTLPEGLDAKAMLPRAVTARVALRARHGVLRRRHSGRRACGCPTATRRRSGSGKGCAGWSA